MLDILAQYKDLVDRALHDELTHLGESSALREAVIYALMGSGKRIRPALVLMMARALGRGLNVIPAALCVEYHHTASLIADDLPCMDDDDERRGRPSCHVAFGETTALLASFALISAGFEQIVRNGELMSQAADPYSSRSNEAVVRALECVSVNTGPRGLIGGQYLDLFAEEPTPALLHRIIQLKTGTLFEMSFVLGWLFGGGELSNQIISSVKRLSHHFGTMFQIVDDLYDAPEDRQAQHAINTALIMGEEASLGWLQKEAASFFNELDQLPIESNEFRQIANGLLLMGEKALQGV